jgi:hypothetical protein
MGFEKSLNIKMGLSATWGDVDWGLGGGGAFSNISGEPLSKIRQENKVPD